MRPHFSERFVRSYSSAPPAIQRAFDRKLELLLHNLRHPSLRAKKYDESRDIWQARVNEEWRFYFRIEGDTYGLIDITTHPKQHMPAGADQAQLHPMNLERARRRRLARAGRQGDGSIFVNLIERHGRWLLPALLAVVTLVAFLPTLENGFVWDDEANLVNNRDYRGLGWHQLRWMFTSFHLGHYIPLTWLTLGLDQVVWGMDPAGYHLMNLLLHMTNSVIVYAIAVRLLAAALPTVGAGIAGRLGSAGAAVLFAVHPLRVESVAWATERRDVLCGLFYLLAVLVYLRVCAAGPTGQGLWRQRRQWAAVGLAALAVLSKSMAVSVPVVLLVLDVYPLRRLGGGWEGWLGAGARRVWLEKAPFVAISGAASLGALVALDKGIIPIDQVSAVGRAAISVYSLAFYLWKMVVPVNLSPLYGLPGPDAGRTRPGEVAGRQEAPPGRPTRAITTVMPGALLDRLGVQRLRRVALVLADGRRAPPISVRP